MKRKLLTAIYSASISCLLLSCSSLKELEDYDDGKVTPKYQEAASQQEEGTDEEKEVERDSYVFLSGNVSSYIIRIRGKENPANPGTFSIAGENDEASVIEMKLQSVPSEYYYYDSISSKATQYTVRNTDGKSKAVKGQTSKAFTTKLDGKTALVLTDIYYEKDGTKKGLTGSWKKKGNDNLTLTLTSTSKADAGYKDSKDFTFETTYEQSGDIVKLHTVQKSTSSSKEAVMTSFFYYDKTKDQLYTVIYPAVDCTDDRSISELIK